MVFIVEYTRPRHERTECQWYTVWSTEKATPVHSSGTVPRLQYITVESMRSLTLDYTECMDFNSGVHTGFTLTFRCTAVDFCWGSTGSHWDIDRTLVECSPFHWILVHYPLVSTRIHCSPVDIQ